MFSDPGDIIGNFTRTQVGICYSLCRSKSSAELMLSVSKRDGKQSFFIFIFTTFEAWPPDALNAHSFIREPWISVLNASNCYKMISSNNDI